MRKSYYDKILTKNKLSISIKIQRFNIKLIITEIHRYIRYYRLTCINSKVTKMLEKN